MDKLDWKTLVNSIKKGHCILVLGPDIAKDSFHGDRKPLTEIHQVLNTCEFRGKRR